MEKFFFFLQKFLVYFNFIYQFSKRKYKWNARLFLFEPAYFISIFTVPLCLQPSSICLICLLVFSKTTLSNLKLFNGNNRHWKFHCISDHSQTAYTKRYHPWKIFGFNPKDGFNPKNGLCDAFLQMWLRPNFFVTKTYGPWKSQNFDYSKVFRFLDFF